MQGSLKIEDLVEELRIDFDDSEEKDYYFFQNLIQDILKITKIQTVTSNNVIFYGRYKFRLAKREIILHFTAGKFTHLTSHQKYLVQTYNEKTFR